MTYAIITAVVLLVLAFVWQAEKRNFLAADRFPSKAMRWGAYAWLVLFVGLLTTMIVYSSGHEPSPAELKSMPFWSLFAIHVLLLVFLAGWWFLSGRPRFREYLNIPANDQGSAVLVGFGVGLGGWLFTIAIAATVAIILKAAGLIGNEVSTSPMIPWMAALPIWQRAIVVFTAMTVEEAFFRGWLQKRAGLLLSTAAFAVGHAGYGQPLMLIGITIVSLVIGVTFYRTRNLIPCIIAHGVFDAIQLFVMIPIAMQVMPH